MVEAFIERRRLPRVAVTGGARLDRPVALSVRLLDIGLSGVLIASSHPLGVGQAARLKVRFGDMNVDADLEIARLAPGRDDKGAYKAGARFVSRDEETRSAIRQFLAAANR